MDELTGLLKTWGIPAAIVFVLVLIFKDIIGRVAGFIMKWITARLRRVWYWCINKNFFCFGKLNVFFGIKDNIHLQDFPDLLRKNTSLKVLQGSLNRDDSIKLNLAEMRDVELQIMFDNQSEMEESENESDEASAEKPAVLRIKWKNVVIGYREIKKFLGICHRSIDEIKKQFSSLANAANKDESIHIEFFYKRNLNFDSSRKEELSNHDLPITITCRPGKMEFGTLSFHYLYEFLPKSLAKNRLNSFAKN